MKAFILSSLVLSQVIGGLVKRDEGGETTAGGHGNMGHGEGGETTAGGHGNMGHGEGGQTTAGGHGNMGHGEGGETTAGAHGNMGHGEGGETTAGGHGNMGHETKGPEPKCCEEKKVGELLYKLFKEVADEDLKQYKCISGCIYKEEEDPEGPSYCFANGELPVQCIDNFHWCYEGKCGPAAWPEVFKGCDGKNQSPIDVPAVPSAGPASMPLTYKDYDKMRATRLKSGEPESDITISRGDRLNGHVSNNGHTAVLGVTGADTNGILSGGPLTAEYRMLQLHFHWGSNGSLGSEHTIEGRAFPMEMHIVHLKVNTAIGDAVAQRDGLAVVGQMFEIANDDNPVLSPLIENLVNIKKYNDEFDMSTSPLKVADLLPAAYAPYANYAGSLTTPPCNEAVNWLLFLTPIKISAGQLEKFRTLGDSHGEAIVDNFRPPQPLNGRVVNFYQ